MLRWPWLRPSGRLTEADDGDPSDRRTFNLWIGNPTPAAVAAYVRSTGADIVLLQEVGPRLEKAITAETGRGRSRTIILLASHANCGLMLLSKAPWTRSGSSDRSSAAPSLVSGAELPRFTVTCVHLAYPFQPLFHLNHIDFLTRRFAGAAGVQILAGDLNLTPGSCKLKRLSAGPAASACHLARAGRRTSSSQSSLLHDPPVSPSVASSGAVLGPRGLGPHTTGRRSSTSVSNDVWLSRSS